MNDDIIQTAVNFEVGDIIHTYEDPNSNESRAARIIRMEKLKMWLQFTDNGDVMEVEWVTKE